MNTLYNNAGYSEAATWIGFEGKEVIGSPDLSNDLSKSAILKEKKCSEVWLMDSWHTILDPLWSDILRVTLVMQWVRDGEGPL